MPLCGAYTPCLRFAVVLDDSVMRRSDALRDMMRFARAIVADGEVSESEAKGFQAWIEANPDVRGLPAVDEIVGILANFFADGKLSEDEKVQLIEVLKDFGG
jgi:hypothetical protein